MFVLGNHLRVLSGQIIKLFFLKIFYCEGGGHLISMVILNLNEYGKYSLHKDYSRNIRNEENKNKKL
jgi:hypothetical protein